MSRGLTGRTVSSRWNRTRVLVLSHQRDMSSSVNRGTRLAFWMRVIQGFAPSTLVPHSSAGVLSSRPMCGLRKVMIDPHTLKIGEPVRLWPSNSLPNMVLPHSRQFLYGTVLKQGTYGLQRGFQRYTALPRLQGKDHGEDSSKGESSTFVLRNPRFRNQGLGDPGRLGKTRGFLRHGLPMLPVQANLVFRERPYRPSPEVNPP